MYFDKINITGKEKKQVMLDTSWLLSHFTVLFYVIFLYHNLFWIIFGCI